jgi:flagellin-like hook-associated protein FlgL
VVADQAYLISSNLVVKLGNGDGTFRAASSSGYAPLSTTFRGALAFGDLNNDGKLDAAMADGFQGVRVLYGNGDGTFQAYRSYAMDSTATLCRAAAVGDLNGDGNLDLVGGLGGSAVSTNLYWRLGNGDGTFRATQSAMVGLAAAVQVADMNGDGRPDLLSTTVTEVDIFIGYGDGTFQLQQTYAAFGSSIIFDLSVADLNRDGAADVVTSDATGTNPVNVFLGNARTWSTYLRPITGLSVSSRSNALMALTDVERYAGQLSSLRSAIGSSLSRFASAGSTVQVRVENTRAAESRITDADVAQESAELVRTGILQQAASAVLAQTNQQPSLALQLLSP